MIHDTEADRRVKAIVREHQSARVRYYEGEVRRLPAEDPRLYKVLQDATAMLRRQGYPILADHLHALIP